MNVQLLWEIVRISPEMHLMFPLIMMLIYLITSTTIRKKHLNKVFPRIKHYDMEKILIKKEYFMEN